MSQSERIRCDVKKHPPNRKPRLLKFLVGFIGVLMLSVGALALSQGSYAWWFKIFTGTPGVIKAGNFAVSVQDASGTAVALPATLITSSSPVLFPGDSAFAQVTLVNNSDVPGTRGQVQVSLPNQPSTTDTAAVRTYLSIALATGQPAGTVCSTLSSSSYINLGSIATNATSAPGATITPDLLSPAASKTWCARLTLSASAPSSVQGQSINVTLPLRIDQVP